jgi:hypothetical protein
MMRSILIATLLVCTFLSAHAQRRQKLDEAFDDKPSFYDRLWFGANAGLRFGGDQTYTSFNLAMFPMVGYKFTKFLSVGPRFGGSYSLFQLQTTNKRYNFLDTEVGAFTRIKFLHMFFIHSEFGRARQNLLFLNQFNGTIEAQKVSRNSFLVGGGYNSGGGALGMELGLYYNLLMDEDDTSFPIFPRFGLTYKF